MAHRRSSLLHRTVEDRNASIKAPLISGHRPSGPTKSLSQAVRVPIIAHRGRIHFRSPVLLEHGFESSWGRRRYPAIGGTETEHLSEHEPKIARRSAINTT